MPIEVKLSDVIEALESAMDEHAYYLDKRSGEIVLVTDDDIAVAENEELMLASPEWQQESIVKAREALNDSENFLPLPDKFEIHEYRIMEEFCLALDNRHVRSELHRLKKRVAHFTAPGTPFENGRSSRTGTISRGARWNRSRFTGWRSTGFLIRAMMLSTLRKQRLELQLKSVRIQRVGQNSSGSDGIKAQLKR